MFYAIFYFVSNFAFQQYVLNTRDQITATLLQGLSLLDIVLCNGPFAICNVVVCEPFSTSDHSSVTFNLNFTNNNFTNGSFVHTNYNFDTVDWNVVNNHLANVDWSSVFSTCV